VSHNAVDTAQRDAAVRMLLSTAAQYIALAHALQPQKVRMGTH